jgi:hypothetical protein
VKRRESGYAAIELGLAVGLLLLPLAVLVLTFSTWFERQSLARVGAREAARTVVLSTDAAGAGPLGAAVVSEVARNHGLAPSEVSVCFAVHGAAERPPRSCGRLGPVGRHAAVTAYVSVRIPALDVPLLSAIAPEITYTARHTERFDAYRSR